MIPHPKPIYEKMDHLTKEIVQNATVETLINIPDPRAVKLHSSLDLYCAVRNHQVSMCKHGNYGK